MPPIDSDLGSAELEVLKVLWDEGPATVRQVLNALHEHGRELAYTTVLTFLTRLEQKGFVRSDKSDLAYVYRAAVSRQKVTQARLRSLVDELYDGATGPLVLQLVEHGRFTKEELDEIQGLIDRLEAARRRGRKKKGGR